MKEKIKHYLLIALAVVTTYFILDNHFIIHGRNVRLLKKTSLNLHHTFVSLDNKTPAAGYRIDSFSA